MIIISIGGIIVVALAVAGVIGVYWLIIGGLAIVSLIGVNIYNIIKSKKVSMNEKRFYDDCINRGIIEVNDDTIEKIKLVGKLHYIQDPLSVFSRLSKPVEPVKKEKKKIDPSTKGIIIGLIVGAIIGVVTTYIINHEWTGIEIVMGILLGICGGFFGGYFADLKQELSDKRARKEEIEEKLKQLE